MRHTTRVLLPALLAALAAAPAAAQVTQPSVGSGAQAAVDSSKPAEDRTFYAAAQQIPIQHFRPTDKRGVNVFEAPKNDPTPYTGFKLMLGAMRVAPAATVGFDVLLKP